MGSAIKALRSIKRLLQIYSNHDKVSEKTAQCVEQMGKAKISKCCIMYKRLQGHVPAYLKTMQKLSSETYSRQTRYANFNVAFPIVKSQKEGGRTFTVTACKLWKSSPLTTRKLCT